MNLELDRNDLREPFKTIGYADTKFEHFKPEVQAAIRAVGPGRAVFWTKHAGDRAYNAINPPAVACADRTFVRVQATTTGANGRRKRWTKDLHGDHYAAILAEYGTVQNYIAQEIPGAFLGDGVDIMTCTDYERGFVDPDTRTFSYLMV